MSYINKFGFMRIYFNLILILFLFLFYFSIGFSCYTPIGGNEDKFFDENSLDNLTICFGEYYFNDSLSDGVFHLVGSNYIFDCNNSVFFGNMSGNSVGLMFDIKASNITLKNCNIYNFNDGINISGIDNLFININLGYISQNSVNVFFENNTFIDIEYNGDYNGGSVFKLINSNNITILNSTINKANYGVWFYNSSFDTLKNLEFNSLGSFGIMLEIGVENSFDNLSFFDISSYAIEVYSSFNYFNNIFINNTNYMSGIDINSNNNTINNSNIYYTSSAVYINGEGNIIDNLTAYNNYNSVTFAFDNNKLINSNLSFNLNYGVVFDSGASNNFIYNNYFSNNPSHVFFNLNTNNFFNISKTLKKNIIGGDYIGGNYYDNYNGSDLDFDGIGDSPFNLSEGVYDYLPLVYLNNSNSSNSSSNNITQKQVNVSIVSNGPFYEGDNILFKIDFSNLEGGVNLSVLNVCSGNVSNISSGYIYNCLILDDDDYNIVFMIFDDFDNFTKVLNISVLNTAPINVVVDKKPNQNISYQFNLSFKDFGILDKFNISVDFGDGYKSLINNTHNRSNIVFYHNYLSDGNYTINISIFDGVNLTTYSYLEEIITEVFKLNYSNQVVINNSFNLSLIIKNIALLNNLTINFNDSYILVDNSSNISNGGVYNHTYDEFGEFEIVSYLYGCKVGVICSIPMKYQFISNIKVIGYGDGIVNNGEECDGNNFNSKTCSNFGFNSGSLVCNNGSISTKNCYNSNSGSGGGGGSSKREKKYIIYENINNTNKVNKSLNISIQNISKNISYKNITKFNFSDYKKNKSLDIENKTLILNKTNREFNKFNNYSSSEKNNSYYIVLKNQTKYDFKPYVNVLFNLLKDIIPKQVYDFNPKMSILFMQFSNEIVWNGLDYNFKPKLEILFNEFNKSFEKGLNSKTNIRSNNSFTYDNYIKSIFNSNNKSNLKENENFDYKIYLDKIFIDTQKNKIKNESFDYNVYLNTIFFMKNFSNELSDSFDYENYLNNIFLISTNNSKKFNYEDYLNNIFNKKMELNSMNMFRDENIYTS